MPTFNSRAEIKDYILEHSKDAVRLAANEAYAVFDKFLQQYYNEFDPSWYDRTYQLLHSLMRTNVRSTGNGWEAEVYFDISSLEYMTGTWSEEKVMISAAHGSHGGYAPGTAVYYKPVGELTAKHVKILKDALIAAGIPVR